MDAWDGLGKPTEHEAARWRKTSGATHISAGVQWVIGRLLYSAKKRAEKRSLPFNLNEEWAARHWNGRCELTGIEFVLRRASKSGLSAFSPSIDRIRPRLGYTQDNCRFILWAVNALKGVGDDRQMIRIARALTETWNENKKKYAASGMPVA